MFDESLFDAPPKKPRKKPIVNLHECPVCHERTRTNFQTACSPCLARHYVESHWRHCAQEKCSNFIVRKDGPYCSRLCTGQARRIDQERESFGHCAREICCNFFTIKNHVRRFCTAACGSVRGEKPNCEFCGEPIKQNAKIHRRCRKAMLIQHCQNEGCYNIFMRQYKGHLHCCHSCSSPSRAATMKELYQDQEYKERWAAAVAVAVADPVVSARRSEFQRKRLEDQDAKARFLEAMQEGARNMPEEKKIARSERTSAIHRAPDMARKHSASMHRYHLNMTPEERAVFRHNAVLSGMRGTGRRQTGAGIKGNETKQLRRLAVDQALAKLAKLAEQGEGA